MRVRLSASAMLVTVLSASGAHAQSRVSVEVGGMVSAYSFDNNGNTAVARSALSSRAINSTSSSMSMSTSPGAGIAAAEVRPSVLMDNGFLFAVGFRAGKAGFGNVSTALVGGDVSIGYQHQFGRFIPFIKGMVGMNSYDDFQDTIIHHTDLRADAVIGSRLYLTQRLFVSASAFAGWGDRYGATFGIGGDVVQFYRRGVMP
jgi:hypothetical protein